MLFALYEDFELEEMCFVEEGEHNCEMLASEWRIRELEMLFVYEDEALEEVRFVEALNQN